MFVGLGRIDHGLGVGDVAVGEHALQVLARDGQHEGVGPGGHDQPVVRRFDGLAGGLAGVHDAFDPVYRGDGPAGVQRDAVVGVPAPVVEHDLFQRLLPGQHRREQDAVVVGVGLGTKNGDVVEVGCDLDQLFERAHASHAVANHDQLRFFHRVRSCEKGTRVAGARVGKCSGDPTSAGHRPHSMWFVGGGRSDRPTGAITGQGTRLVNSSHTALCVRPRSGRWGKTLRHVWHTPSKRRAKYWRCR